MSVRVLTWNLFHGRAVPDVPHSLRAAFEQTLAGWEWDVALLQEVPAWWPEPLARACDARAFSAPTSRNQLHVVRQGIGRRRPDLIKSGGGGANAILVRGHGVSEHHRLRLRLWPERRVVHAVRRDDGIWFGTLHATAHDELKAQEDLNTAAAAVRRWAGADPIVIGADCNTHTPRMPGLTHAGGHVLDHLFARGLSAVGPVRRPARGGISDHVPVIATMAAGPPP